jgi:hypothetical protein
MWKGGLLKVTDRGRELCLYSSSESAVSGASLSNGVEWNRQSAGAKRHKRQACAGQVPVRGGLSYVIQKGRISSVYFPWISYCCCSHTLVNAASTWVLGTSRPGFGSLLEDCKYGSVELVKTRIELREKWETRTNESLAVSQHHTYIYLGSIKRLYVSAKTMSQV